MLKKHRRLFTVQCFTVLNYLPQICNSNSVAQDSTVLNFPYTKNLMKRLLNKLCQIVTRVFRQL